MAKGAGVDQFIVSVSNEIVSPCLDDVGAVLCERDVTSARVSSID